ncbi:hypothetical protein RB595_007920 [Gaeumannomyces hyphopodioides]
MMDANEFRKAAEAGEIPIDSHDQVLRIAYIYTDEGAWWENGVFDVVDKLRARGWPFGQGNFKFNRTLDTFYVAQIMAGHYNSSDQLNNEILTTNMFDSFYSQQRELIDQDAWKQYYSPSFLVQAASARFYRLPNLRDLPDASDPLANPRDRGTGHFTKLYHWAYAVARTRAVEPTLPAVTIDHLALSTLRRTASRLRDEVPAHSLIRKHKRAFGLNTREIPIAARTPMIITCLLAMVSTSGRNGSTCGSGRRTIPKRGGTPPFTSCYSWSRTVMGPASPNSSGADGRTEV